VKTRRKGNSLDTRSISSDSMVTQRDAAKIKKTVGKVGFVSPDILWPRSL